MFQAAQSVLLSSRMYVIELYLEIIFSIYSINVHDSQRILPLFEVKISSVISEFFPNNTGNLRSSITYKTSATKDRTFQ